MKNLITTNQTLQSTYPSASSNSKLHISKWMFLLLIVPYAAYYLTTLTDTHTLQQKINNPYFWVAFFYSLAVAYLTIFFIAFAFKFVNRKRHVSLVQRLTSQIKYTFLPPIIVITILASIYFYSLGKNIISRHYFYNELPIITVFVAIINAYFLIKFSIMQTESLKRELKKHQQNIQPAKIIVTQKNQQIPLLVNQIAFIRQEHQIIWAITTQLEYYNMSGTLKQIAEKLPKANFFQVNRNTILNNSAIKSWQNGAYGKLIVNLNLNYPTVIVSKDRAKNFRSWVSTKMP